MNMLNTTEKVTDNISQLKNIDPKTLTNSQIKEMLFQQVESLQQDIKNLDEFRSYVENLFPRKFNFNSTHIIENKLRVMSQFYSTFLSYKQELIKLLLKLEDIVQPQYTEHDINQIIVRVIQKLEDSSESIREQEERIKKVINKHLDKFLPTNSGEIKQDISITKKLISSLREKEKNKKNSKVDNEPQK